MEIGREAILLSAPWCPSFFFFKEYGTKEQVRTIVRVGQNIQYRTIEMCRIENFDNNQFPENTH